MLQLLGTMWQEEDGQDLVEYTLLVAFIVFITAGVVSLGGASIKGIVNATNRQLAAANSSTGL